MTRFVITRSLLSLVAAAFLFFAAVAGCGKAGQAIQGVQELQPKAEERNWEIEGLAQPERASP